MPNSAATDSSRLPATLRAQFAALERRLWRLESSRALAGALIGPALTLGLLWLSDRLWDTPIWLRTLLFLLACAATAAYAIGWARHWVWQKRDLRALSRLVQQQQRRLGDRLLGAVELATGSNLPAEMSPSLCQAAIDQVAGEAAKHDFQTAANPRSTRRHLLTLAGLAFPLLAVCFAVPAAGWNAIQRWALPLADIERYTFVQLAVAQPAQVVPHGEEFTVPVEVRYRAFWRPASVRAQLGQQPELRTQVEQGNIRLTVPGQTQPGQLTIHVGDARARIAIEPMHRPALKELVADVELPAYLKYPAQTETLRGGSYSLLEGSKAGFRGTVNRPIVAAHLSVNDRDPIQLPVKETTFETPVSDWVGASTVNFGWQDASGLTNRAAWTLGFSRHQDQPPTIALPGLPPDQALLETDILPIKLAGTDDYGVKELGIRWLLASALDLSGKPLERVYRFNTSSPQNKAAGETYLLSPSLLGIPPDTIIEVRGLALDHFPDRAPVMTEPHRVYVIGLVRHAEVIRQQLENLFAQLEEVTRREESIAAKTRELSDLPEQKLSTEEAGKAAGEQAKEQQRNAQDLERLAREGAQTVREAMRNPTFNEETIRDWARTLKGMQDVAQQEMKQAGEQLQSAQQQQSSSQQRSQDLAQAQQSEQQALDKLQQLQQQVNKGLDSLQAQTLAQRLRRLGGQETQLGGRLQELVAETIGLRPDQLSEHHRRANSNISGDQDKAREEAGKVHEEMSRFFDRTQRENYGEVAKAMKEGNVTNSLDQVRGLVASNITFQAMNELGTWAQRFTDWADKLEPKKDSQSGSGQGQGQGDTPQDDLTRQLMALLRMREKENTLRQQTRLLDEQKQEVPKFDESVRKLAETQQQLREDLERLQRENGVPQLDEALQEGQQAMKQAEALLRSPNTGEPTDKAQVKVLEVLTDLVNLINEQAQQQQQQSAQSAAAAQEMEFLMQMAQQQPGQGKPMLAGSTPGMNQSGGGTGQPGNRPAGDARGADAAGRSVDRGSGSTRAVPAEFRSALENYYKAMEARQ